MARSAVVRHAAGCEAPEGACVRECRFESCPREPDPRLVMAARPLVEALGAVAWCMGAVGRGAERVKRWIVPREAFVGNLANEDIDERPVAGERVD